MNPLNFVRKLRHDRLCAKNERIVKSIYRMSRKLPPEEREKLERELKAIADKYMPETEG